MACEAMDTDFSYYLKLASHNCSLDTEDEEEINTTEPLTSNRLWGGDFWERCEWALRSLKHGSDKDDIMSEGKDMHMHQLSLEKGNHPRKQTEHDNLVERERKLSLDTAVRLRIGVLIMSWASVIILGILGIITLVIGIIDGSTAAFAFALDALLDCLSSLVVIWRFSGNASTLYSAQRERMACITLGALFIISSVIITTRSSISLATETAPGTSDDSSLPTDTLWILALINGLVCIVFVSLKVYFARKLDSISIATDAVNSGIGVLMAFSTLISDRVYDENPSVWYLDSIIGIVCAMALLGYGIWVIVYEVRASHK